MDDTFAIQHTEHKNFLQHINGKDSAIKFTEEDTKLDGSMPFHDTLVTPEHNETLNTRVCKKPTHANQKLTVGQPPPHRGKIQHNKHSKS